MDDIKETTDTKLEKAAVVEFKLSEPLKISDKPFFLVTIEGFGTDPSKKRSACYIDVKPVEMDESMAGNLLAHNSYCRLKGEDDYLRPINYYGGQLGESFMICPVIDTHTEEGVGIQGVEALKPAYAQYKGRCLVAQFGRCGTSRGVQCRRRESRERCVGRRTSRCACPFGQRYLSGTFYERR